MRALALDPSDFKYLLVMHGHGDHWGAGRYLQEKYRLRVALGAEDWRLLEAESPARTFLAGRPSCGCAGATGRERESLESTYLLLRTPGYQDAVVVPALFL